MYSPISSVLYPLTSPQREIWFDQILHENVPLYNIGGYVKILGQVDVALFEQAVNLLIKEHDTLRTVLSEEMDKDGIPMQTYAKELSIKLAVKHFSAEAQPHEAAMKWMQQRFAEPFELKGKGQVLFRYDLVKVNDECYYWLMQYHHLIVDGYSVAFLTRSLAAIYTQLAQGQTPELKNIPYTHFVEYDQQFVTSEAFEQNRQYWADKYPTAPEPLLQPRYRTQLGSDVVGSECQSLTLSRDFYQRLHTFAKAYNTTLFRVFLGVLYVYFVRIAQRDDFTVGYPTLNRSLEEFQHIAGLFTLVIPSHFQFGQQLSFAELLAHLHQQTKADVSHSYPLSAINKVLSHGEQRSILFDISVSYQRFDYDSQFNGLDTQTTWLQHAWEQNPLAIYIQDFNAQADVKLDFVYNLTYFNAEDVKALQARFMIVLEAVLENSSLPIHQLPIMTEQEIQQLQAWNNTTIPYSQDQTIVDLFEQQVEKTPNNIAVVFENESLTYQQLNEKSNQLAHYLLSLKSSTDNNLLIIGNCLIAIAVERSLDMVIGLLGILKAGGAYVPVDPDYPTARVQHMLTDSAPPILLTQNHLKMQLPLDALQQNCEVICLDEMTFNSQSIENPDVNRNTKDLAYIIYTSGSTGKPKGVMVEQHNLLNFLLDMQQRIDITSSDKLLAVTTLSFDIAALELYLPLISGSCLHLATKAIASDVLSLQQYLATHAINFMQATPATWQMLKHSDWNPKIPPKILCGGEALLPDLANYLLEKSQTLWNVYGPTETTIWSTAYQIQTHLNAYPSIGTPIANTRIYILDNQNYPQPPNIPGELCIAGEGLARGYLNRPELTAEKFIEIKIFGKTERIYKTGDLACWLPDGNIEYFGRIDHQVKLRGFRIELGEIEVVLNQYEVVKNAVVILCGINDNKYLVAYLELQATNYELQALVTKLKNWLKSHIPDYMIPSSFIIQNKLPLTPNGKIDRITLKKQAEKENFTSTTSDYIPPRTMEEQILATIWTELLGVERVSVHDNFFELGGHSLLATRTIARIRDHLGVELTIKTLFQNRTLEKLAAYISQGTSQSGYIPFTNPNLSTNTQLLMSMSEWQFFHAQHHYPDATGIHNTAHAYRLHGELNITWLEQSLKQVAQEHISLRTGFEHKYSMQFDKIVRTIQNDFKIPLKIIDLKKFPENKRLTIAEQQLIRYRYQRFPFPQGPLWCCVLWQISENQYWLLFVMHHIVSDAWGITAMMQKISTNYSMLEKGLSLKIDKKPFHYEHFAAWQWQFFKSEQAQTQREYWCQVLKDLPAPWTYPDRPRFRFFTKQVDAGAQIIEIKSKLTNELQQLSHQNQTTLYVTLLTAFNLLLSAYMQRDDLIVVTPFANRTQTEFENEVGLFTHGLPIRTNLQGNPSGSELLAQVTANSMEVTVHQQTPFFQIIEWLEQAEGVKPNRLETLLQVIFVLLNTPKTHLSLGRKLNTNILSLSDIKQPQPIHIVAASLLMIIDYKSSNADIICTCVYRKDMFDAALITQFCTNYQIILQRLVDNPNASKATLLQGLKLKTKRKNLFEQILQIFKTKP